MVDLFYGFDSLDADLSFGADSLPLDVDYDAPIADPREPTYARRTLNDLISLA